MKFNHARATCLINELFRITDELQKMTGRRFTPDGYLVDSLGEVFAASAYGLTLENSHSMKACDARDKEGRRVEIKATFGERVAFRLHDPDCEPDRCLVMRLRRDADFDEIYNGPTRDVLEMIKHRKPQSNGQIQVPLAQLRSLNAQVKKNGRLSRVDG